MKKVATTIIRAENGPRMGIVREFCNVFNRRNHRVKVKAVKRNKKIIFVVTDIG